MALRLKADNAYGKFAGISTSATTLTSDELPRLPAVSAPDVIAVTLDWNRRHGEPEIVHVTDYDGVSNTATIERGKEGTTARTHPGSPAPDWVHGFTVLDEGLLAHSDGTPTPGGLLQVKSLDPFIVEHLPSDAFVNDAGETPQFQADTRANQPGAGTVPVGSLYWVTDEDLVERSDGAAWNPHATGTSADHVHDALYVNDGGGVPSFTADTRANQPAAGTAGRLFHVTDEDVVERDNGTSWVQVRDLAHRNNTANPHSVTHSQVGAPTTNPHAVTHAQVGAPTTNPHGVTHDQAGAQRAHWEDIRDHGAAVDGGTDDTAAVQSASDSMPNGGIVFVPPGTTRVDGPVTLGDAVTLWIANGATVDVTQRTGDAFSATGTITDPTAVTADVPRGALTVNVASGDEAPFLPGDWVQLRCDILVGRLNQPQRGEIHTVASTADGQITLDQSTWHPYPSADAATIERLHPVADINVVGGGRIYDGSNGAGPIFHWRVCSNINVEGMRITMPNAAGLDSVLNLDKCMSVKITRNHFQDIPGYCILPVNGTHWLTITSNTAVNCPDWYDQGGSSADHGMTRFVTIVANTITNSGVSCHSSSQYMVIASNTMDLQGNGVFIRGGDVIIKGNKIRGDGSRGIEWSCEYDLATYMIIVGNDIEITGEATGVSMVGSGTEAGIAPEDMRDITISDNRISVRDSTGSAVISIKSGGGRAIRGVTINGNNAEAPAGYAAIYLNNADLVTYERVMVGGNHLRGGSYGVRGNNGITESWIDGNIISGTTPISAIDAAHVGTNREIVT